MTDHPSDDAPALPELADVTADERTTLTDMLDYYRTVFLRKVWGLSDEQLDIAHPPSSLTLGGMLFHMILVEDSWFEFQFLGEPEREPFASFPWEEDHDYEFHHAKDWTGAERIAMFNETVARCQQIIAENPLDQLSVRTSERRGGHWSLRWIVVHMIEEYARHCGHADLIREAIDGTTAD